MKNLIYLAIVLFAVTSCTATYETAAVYDDVYYTPDRDKKVVSQSTTKTTRTIHSGTAASDSYSYSSQPESATVENNQQKSYQYVDDTIPAASNNEYYYVEETEEYYDYDYANRINRFHNNYGNFGYYAPVYGGYPYYGSGLSFSYGMGFPSSYFSMGFGWGWGGGYYNPWYYDPWYSPWYGGGSYWMGYNHGYYNGYWNGYYAGGGYYPGGGGYYPGGGGEGVYPERYYGPRDSRGSSIIGSREARGSRINNSGDDEMKSSVSPGRESRINGAAAAKAGGTTTPAVNERASRSIAPA
ncbi:MAG: hypothetical protein GX103_07280, partial [Bacteroidales bacterium]|nr:hypothetical protein [Bacteroidales bacterium]